MKRGILFLLILSLLAGNTAALAAQNEANPDTAGWYVYEYPKADEVDGTLLDVSGLLDAPAGKHGFLIGTDGEKFCFEDGTRIRFFGMNLAGASAYMDYPDAAETAKRLAQNGFNIVRLHLIDSGSRDGIWGRKAVGGRVLRKDIMDRLCFLFSELKKRGIYIMIDLMISMPPTADLPYTDLENMENGLKTYSYFDEALIEEQKKYADMLLSYYNPYTGMRLKDDPALALIDLKNEDFLLGKNCLGSEYYEDLLEQEFNTWLLEKYGTREALKAVWESTMVPGEVAKTHISDADYSITEPALAAEEDPAMGTVALFEHRFQHEDNLPINRQRDKIQFLAMVQERYYSQMTAYLREIGVKCRVTGATCFTTNGRDRPMYYSNRNTDFIDSHTYTAMVSSVRYTDGAVRTAGPDSMLADGWASVLNQTAARTVYGLPNTISEWNDVAPNKYRSESMILMSAYSALRGMHPFCFAWCDDSEGIAKMTTDNYAKTCFGFSESPEQMAAMPAAARIFLRGDVQEAEAGYYPMRQRGDEPFAMDRYVYTNETQWMANLGLIGKTGMIFDDKAYDPGANDHRVLYLARNAAKNKAPYISITGQLSADLQNQIFRMNTEKSQAVSGFIAGQEIELDDIQVRADNPFATICLNAAEDQPIYQSERLLLTVLGDTRNTGMTLSDDEKTIIAAGAGPVLVEPIVGEITIKTQDPVAVYALTSAGQRRMQKPTAKTTEGYTRFRLEAADKAMHYEIVMDHSGGTVQNAHVSLGSTEMPALFTDTNGSPYQKEIEDIALYTDLTGSIGAAFRPEEQITKREFSQLLIKALRLEQKVWYDTVASPFYDMDVTEEGFRETSIAYILGGIKRTRKYVLFQGYQYYIYPDKPMTRGEAMEAAAKILKRTYRNTEPAENFDMGQYNDYAKYAQDPAIENYRYMMGLGYLGAEAGGIAPDAALTRGEAAEMIYKILWNS